MQRHGWWTGGSREIPWFGDQLSKNPESWQYDALSFSQRLDAREGFFLNSDWGRDVVQSVGHLLNRLLPEV